MKTVIGDCIVWPGGKTKTGYGKARRDGIQMNAHRAIWIDSNGEIPGTLEVDHLCGNRACVNLDHLELVTHAENLRRSNCPSGINARKTHCIHGHELIPENLVPWQKGKRKCLICHRRQMSEMRERKRKARL